MIQNQLKEQFDNMLPYLKEQSTSLIKNILSRAEKIESQGQDINIEEFQKILRDAEKILSLDRKLKNLFSQIS